LKGSQIAQSLGPEQAIKRRSSGRPVWFGWNRQFPIIIIKKAKETPQTRVSLMELTRRMKIRRTIIPGTGEMGFFSNLPGQIIQGTIKIVI